MSEYWKSFLVGFCKVEAVCFEGDPNWLGWILIGILVIVLVIVLIIVLNYVLRHDLSSRLHLSMANYKFW